MNETPTGTKPFTFVLADAQEEETELLERVIRKIFPGSEVVTCSHGEETWHIVRKQKEPVILLIDLFLPVVNGLQITKKIRAEIKEPELYIIVLTESKERDMNLKALQSGADDILYKPMTTDRLLAVLRNASQVLTLKENLSSEKERNGILYEDLEKDTNRFKELLADFEESRMPGLKKSLARITEASLWLAKEIGIEEKSIHADIEIASQLCYVGKLFLNEKMYSEPVMKRGIVSGSTMESVPGNAKKLLCNLRGLEGASELLYHLYENFDGSGIPDKLQGWEIPIGSRIIRVTADFEDLMRANNNIKPQSYAILEHEIKRLYDFKIVALFDQYFAVTQDNPRIKEISVHRKELEDGMIVSRNIYTESGMKIIAAGTELDDEMIEKIRTITKEDPYIGKIYIMPKGY